MCYVAKGRAAPEEPLILRGGNFLVFHACTTHVDKQYPQTHPENSNANPNQYPEVVAHLEHRELHAPNPRPKGPCPTVLSDASLSRRVWPTVQDTPTQLGEMAPSQLSKTSCKSKTKLRGTQGSKYERELFGSRHITYEKREKGVHLGERRQRCPELVFKMLFSERLSLSPICDAN